MSEKIPQIVVHAIASFSTASGYLRPTVDVSEPSRGENGRARTVQPIPDESSNETARHRRPERQQDHTHTQRYAEAERHVQWEVNQRAGADFDLWSRREGDRRRHSPAFSSPCKSHTSILSGSSVLVLIWLKAGAISTLFRSFLPPLRSSHNLALSIDRRTAYHLRNATAQQGEFEFGHSRSIPSVIATLIERDCTLHLAAPM